MSLDCEGKWGMADLTMEHREALTNERLNEAYSKLTEILQLYQIKATFAFVGAFTMTMSEFKERQDWFSEVSINGRQWLNNFEKDMEVNQFDGWLNPKALDIVRSSNIHELASHGFTHLPLSESLINRETFLNQMNRMRQIMTLKDIDISTFVYPRNMVGYPSELKLFGIKGYRMNLFQNYKQFMQKPKSLLNEINLFQSAQNHSVLEEIIRIPSGYFLKLALSFKAKNTYPNFYSTMEAFY